jgi:hypothetical protein
MSSWASISESRHSTACAGWWNPAVACSTARPANSSVRRLELSGHSSQRSAGLLRGKQRRVVS